MTEAPARPGPPSPEPPILPPPAPARRPGLSGALWRFLRREWVHVAMVLGALFGIAYTSAAGPATAGGTQPQVFWVWLILAPLYCLACIAEGWRGAAASGAGRWRLVATQALHWLAFLAVMWVVLMPGVRGVLDDNAVGLALLLLLAMGTFVAGVHAWSPGICVTGLLLGLAVPAVAWLQESAVLLLLVGAALAAVALGVLALVRRLGGGAPGPTAAG